MPNNKLILRTLNSPYVGNAGDITKGNVLTHSELDENFIFLKGEDILSATTSATTLTLHKVNTSTIDVDLATMIAGADTFTTGTTLVGSTLYFNRTDAYSAYTADLSPLLDDTNFYTTGGTVVGQTIIYDRNDTLSAYTVDISGVIPDVDYGNVIYVSEVGPTGDTRVDVVGNPLKPVSLEWASQIAQSGDTIFVEAGVYNLTISGVTNSLSVNGVNHYFKQGAKVYKTTLGHMFSREFISSGGDVYGLGSFYGSNNCTYIYNDFGGDIVTFEFDSCINTANHCYFGFFNNITYIRGRKEIISTAGMAINNNASGSLVSLYVDCPIIRSTTTVALNMQAPGGGFKNITVNAVTIENTTNGIALALGTSTGNVIINANYVNNVYAISGGGGPLKLLLNVKDIDYIVFGGTSLECTGHVKEYNHQVGLSNIAICDKVTGGNGGSVTTSLNGNIANTISELSGTATFNLKLASTLASANLYSERRIINIGSIANVYINSDWICNNLEFNISGGTLNIPNNANINIGPDSTGTTFNISGGRVNLSGKVVQTTTEASHKIMDLPIAGTVVYNGATIIVSSQDKQIITSTNVVNNVKIYTGGLNTNKLFAFTAEQEKRKVNVIGTGATITISGQTFVSTTGTTNAQRAVELTTLINASSILITASQDTPGTNTYFYIEADVPGDAMTIVYNLNTSLNGVIRYNNKGVYDTVGGIKIEDSDID